MELQTLKQANDWQIISVNANLGRRQQCMVEDCGNMSFSRLEISSQFHHVNDRFVCSNCASALTEYSVSKLEEAEKYVQCVKPHMTYLRKGEYNTPLNSKKDTVAGYLQRTVGDRRVLITALRDGKYMLLINGDSFGPGRYNAFLNKKLVTEYAIQIINKHYTEINLMAFIQRGTPFVMP